MEFPETLLILLELGVIAYVGSQLGKIIHHFLVGILKRALKRNPLALDVLWLQYVEHPLRLSIMVLAILFVSSTIPNLEVIEGVMNTYGIAILIVLSAFTLSETIGAVLRWYYEISKTHQTKFLDLTLLPFIRKVTRIIFVLAGSVIALSVVGVEVSGLLAITSVGALILGLASQESLANVFAGLALQLDRPAAYGDYVRNLNGEILRLQKIGSRSAKFLDLDGNLVVISNSELAKQRLTNLSNPHTGFHTMLRTEVPGRVSPERVNERVSQLFKEEVVKKTAARASPGIVETLTRDGYILLIPVTVKDAPSLVLIRDKINRAIVEEAYSPQPEKMEK